MSNIFIIIKHNLGNIFTIFMCVISDVTITQAQYLSGEF